MAAGGAGGPEGGAKPTASTSIQVVVRVRPLLAREQDGPAGAAAPPLECTAQAVRVCGHGAGLDGSPGHAEGKAFGYDHVFDSQATQEEVFEAVGARLLANALDAYNGCIFAYGQTGSGKSHSVVGSVHSEAEQGLLPRACARLFQMLAARRQGQPGLQANVLASYLEIYNERLFDLLSGGRDERGELQVRLHPGLGAVVPGLSECPVEGGGDALALLDFGAKRRATAATQMNATSSRSHAVFTVQVHMVLPGSDGAGETESWAKVHFVDLAGSERQKKTGARGDRLKEGISINKSLTTLGRVISDLTRPGGRSLPPFRDSKLTLLLKDALMGNSLTALLACVSPSRDSLDETVSTLEFASRCKLVQTQATRNEQSKQDVIARLSCEKGQLEEQLRRERADSELLCARLREELERAGQRHAAEERALEERRAAQARLEELELQHRDLRRASEEQLSAAREQRLAAEHSCRLLQERERLQERELRRKSEELDALVREKREAEAEAAARAGEAAGPPEPVPGGGAGAREAGGAAPAAAGPGGGAGGEGRAAAAGAGAAPAGDDGPGEYTVVRQTWVTSGRSTRSRRLAQLGVGAAVAVVEVARLADEQRIRGRIEEPAGWFSIEDTADCFRWAVRGGGGAAAAAASTEGSESAEPGGPEEPPRGGDRGEEELRERLEREREAQLARERELLSQIEALRGVQESFALDQAQLDAKRDAQRRQREQELAELGMHAVGIEAEDLPLAPRLVNLHPDPALGGCLVYYLPLGETCIGSERRRCRVTLTGLDIGAEVCAIANEANEALTVRPLGGGLVRVNGLAVDASAGQRLCHGDRLAVGRAYIFQAQIPRARSASEDAAARPEEGNFERAMEEISAGAEVDPQWERGVQRAMQLARADFGPEAAGRLLAQARKASEACKTANSVLRQMPASWTDGVVGFDLSVMFDSHGLPEVCVVARRESPPGPADALRGSGPSAGIWEVEAFWGDRLPAMLEALTSSGVAGADPEDGELPEEPGPEDWQSRVWSELRVEDYRAMAEALGLERAAPAGAAPPGARRASPRAEDPRAALAAAAPAAAALDAGGAGAAAGRRSVLGSVLRGMRRSSSTGGLRRACGGLPAAPAGLLDGGGPAGARRPPRRGAAEAAALLARAPDAFHS